MLTSDNQRSRDLFNEVWAACAEHTLANAKGTGNPAALFETMREKFIDFSEHEKSVERERCAKIADDWKQSAFGLGAQAVKNAASSIADDIRNPA